MISKLHSRDLGMQADARRDVMACPLLEFVFWLYVHADKTSTNLLDLADVRLVRRMGGLHP
jgi:hypothetical protein